MNSIPIIDPSSKFKMVWDFFILILILFFSFFIPVCTVFKGDITSSSIILYEQFFMIKIFLVVDSIVRLNTGIFDKGILIIDRVPIIKNYF